MRFFFKIFISLFFMYIVLKKHIHRFNLEKQNNFIKKKIKTIKAYISLCPSCTCNLHALKYT